MSRTDDFLARHGMDPAQIDLAACTAAFLDHMERGLRGEPSSILMLPTYLTGDGALAPDEPVIVIDAGGTNLRAALVTLTESGPRIEGLQVRPMPGSLAPVSWAEFLSAVADLILPLTARSGRVGFCFSYPAEITPERDGRMLRLTKQVKITGAVGRPVCADLARELRARGAPDLRFVLLNDTAAALMGGVAARRGTAHDGFIGLVYGTGINTCCAVRTSHIPKLSGYAGADSMIINLESGGFTGLPRGDMDLALDAATADPGAYLYEKMVSGAYLGDLLLLTLRQARAEGLLSPGMADGLEALSCLDTAQADAFLVDARGRNTLAGVCRIDRDREVVREIGERLAARAAKLVCANLSAILLLTGRGRSPEKPVCIMAEGSAIRKSSLLGPLLERCLTEYATDTLGRSWTICRTENTNLLGSAAAALLNT